MPVVIGAWSRQQNGDHPAARGRAEPTPPALGTARERVRAVVRRRGIIAVEHATRALVAAVHREMLSELPHRATAAHLFGGGGPDAVVRERPSVAETRCGRRGPPRTAALARDLGVLAWQVPPALGMGHAHPWPELAEMSAAQAAGFLHAALAGDWL